MMYPDASRPLVLQTLLQKQWQVPIESLVMLGKGVYGHCYGVTLAQDPWRMVVKLHTIPGMAAQEEHQLRELHMHLPTLVPQPYALLPATPLVDALLMQWLPGQSCPRPELLPHSQRRQVQQRVVELLVELHRIEHPAGYGPFDGPFVARWWDAYGPHLHAIAQAIEQSEQAQASLGPQVLALMQRSLQWGEQIVSTSAGRPVLLHGDYCVNNLLFDPSTWLITGLLDPMDAQWGDRELDLVNLINGHIHHFELLNRYREQVDLGPSFPVRYWFYQVWKWLSYYVRVGTPVREWVLRCGRELDKGMERLL